jgi:hypothetical protein
MQSFKQYLSEASNPDDKQIREMIGKYKSGELGRCRFPNKFPRHAVKNGKIYLKKPLIIEHCMFDDNDELLFPIAEALRLVIWNVPKTFKNFPEIVGEGGIEFSTGNQIQSLDGFPSDISNRLDTSRIRNFDFTNFNKYVKRLDGWLITSALYEGPLLSLLKIRDLKHVGFIDHHSGKSQDEVKIKVNLRNACNIINKYLPLGNFIECQRELIENDLDEYAEL